MKKLNKFFAILVSLAMMATLCVCMAFAEGTTPAPNTTDFAVTKLLKVPTGTAIPANSSVNVKIDFVSLNSVPATDAQNTAYDREITLNLSGDPAATETDGATTYYYFTTGNMLEELGLDQAGAGVYKFEISENTYKINNTAYDALEAPENATIEEGGTFELTVAKTVNNTYSITASLDENKVEVKDVKTDEEHDASIEDNGVKLINTRLLQLGCGPGGEHNGEHLADALLRSGDALGIAIKQLLQMLIPTLGGVHLAVMGGQLYEEEIQVAVENQVVAFVLQVAVDVFQQAANLLHGKAGFEHVNG